MSWKEINKEYINLIKSDPEGYIADYKVAKEKVANSTAIYKGKPVPFLYHPMFYTEEDVENFRKIGDTLISITNKVTQRYLDSKEFRKKFEYSPLLEELILVDSGYDINVPIGRFDLFYNNKDNFKFCELNTDGSSAMNEDNTIGNILLQTKGLQDFSQKHSLALFELINRWVDDSISIFRKWNSEIEKPNVAIVDFTESGTSKEFEVFKNAFIKKGYNTIIADPRELKYRNGHLYLEDFKIDLVYRRIVTFELIEKAHEVPDFIEAYKNKAFCCIGSIKSQIIHNKIIFKILHDEDTLEFLSEDERNFVKRHIPVTGLFKGEKEVYNKVLSDKDKYIMKPLDLNASRGVYAGRDLSQDEWEKRLDESFDKDYLYQEFFEPFTREHVIFEDDELKIEEFRSIVGLFMYKEKFAGIYTRIGKNNIISGVTDYYTLPNILVK
ncbi:glutathionylspermidine synthase family protein [Tissierella carlieri]|jgi:glutathionylspermidine synthase|uniref:glutathionylspermidine synthase family protein n=1 Tax=Tissierella TaxID=41273 RepID=UPI002805140F|nr:glutathionylspermidine synthase family protein [uncultured Tissierella sp.]MDU5083403.1 glutathionylspermidine synthase family protein [Bacillota bacterium]